ncbi:hypothetical protein F7725_010945 [Dissostichus mawsoni]|uniref:Intraflagellar transport protein 57 homolog n=1 Tax=Dissostichus mawsoni TaxID=36200 RepID=A0A7J5Z7F5_DISMA|nr:hypothetical protein F7725_010945 [Dissostichus mawsoni]
MSSRSSNPMQPFHQPVQLQVVRPRLDRSGYRLAGPNVNADGRGAFRRAQAGVLLGAFVAQLLPLQPHGSSCCWWLGSLQRTSRLVGRAGGPCSGSVVGWRQKGHKRQSLSETAMRRERHSRQNVFVVMESLLEKLKFFLFTVIAAWLINEAGRPFTAPQEHDEPNATVSNILSELRAFVDFPPSKLKSGSGEFVCFVPNYPAETTEEESVIEDDAELTLSKVEEEMIEEPDDEEENVMDLEALKLRTCPTEQKPPPNRRRSWRPRWMQQSGAWRWRESCRSSKSPVRTDNKDWRIHVEQMHQHRDGIKSSLKEATSYLDRLQEDVGKTLEKVSSREKYINNQLESLIQEYRGAQAKLSQISEELEKVKQEMEEKGSSMSDGAPVVKIKQSLTKLKQEIIQMDVRIGVVEHTLLYSSTKGPSLRHTSTKGPSLRFTSIKGPSLRYSSNKAPTLWYTSTKGPPLRFTSTLGLSLRYSSTKGPPLRFTSIKALLLGPYFWYTSTLGLSLWYSSTKGPYVRFTSNKAPSLRFTSTLGPSLRYSSTLGPSIRYSSTLGPSLRYSSTLGPSLRFISTLGPSIRFTTSAESLMMLDPSKPFLFF